MTARSRLFEAAAVIVALAAGAVAATAAAGRLHTTKSVPKPALVWSGANRGGNGTRDIYTACRDSRRVT
jgi:hypothetical protein